MAKEYSRIERVEDLILRELAKILQRKMQDPRLARVTISAVKVSRDLSHARVYISLLDESRVKEILTVLNKAAGFLRYQLANTIELRITPQLKFVHDIALSQGNKLSALIDEAIAADLQNKKNNKDEGVE